MAYKQCARGWTSKRDNLRELLMNNLFSQIIQKEETSLKEKYTFNCSSRIYCFSSAKRFLEEGANVFISDVHEARLDEAIKNLKDMNLGEVEGCLCNVTSDEDIEIMFNKAISCFSHLDGVINNAGLGGESSLENMTNEAWNLVLDVTLNGAMKIMRAAIPISKVLKE